MGAKNEKSSYEPNKIRSRPLRCILLPIFTTFLFILYWFSLCPLLYVALRKMNYGWTSNWHYYYWFVAFVVFLIILGLLVLLWRKRCKTCGKGSGKLDVVDTSSKLETKELLIIEVIDVGEDALQLEELNKNIKVLEKKLDGNDDVNNVDKVSIENNLPEKECDQTQRDSKPDTLKSEEDLVSKLPPKVETGETSVELHSPAYPLTPREIFFWDLIQNANKNDSVKFNFENKDSLGDLAGTPDEPSKHNNGDSADNLKNSVPPETSGSVIPKTSDSPRLRHHSCPAADTDTQYFIANVPNRQSLTSEVYIYVDGGKDEKYLQIRMEDCV